LQEPQKTLNALQAALEVVELLAPNAVGAFYAKPPLLRVPVVLTQGPSLAGLAYEARKRVDVLFAFHALHVGVVLSLGRHDKY